VRKIKREGEQKGGRDRALKVNHAYKDIKSSTDYLALKLAKHLKNDKTFFFLLKGL
jgi:hypothetical protein